MAPPRPTITPHIGVPKVSFRKIQPVGKEYDGVDEKLFHQFGYNEVSIPFERPEHYIRYIDPVESELLVQVEYDMDEQDDEWLTAVNNERYKEQTERVSSETFEIIIDRLEKEWFELMKRVPKPDQALPSEDSTCAVCDDGEGENSNAIVFCDGCNLAVHQDCYGVPYIPEGQWLCRKCTVAPETRVECILCPNDGGAFKQTSNGKWAHLLCAIWVPECVLGNPTFMEPIENSDKIPKQRWKLVCSICKVKQGACIQCNKNTCVTAFHVSCARRHKLLSPMKSHGENELQAFCEKHLPTDMRVNRVVPPSPSMSAPAPASPVRSPKKSVRTQAQPTGPPLVPIIIVDKIMQYTSRITFRKKLPFLLAVCRYWTLKREARRGAPLLKRLHLEPWATSTATKLQTDDDKLKYLDNLYRLRNDLERVRTLADLIRQREGEKQTGAQAVESFVATCLLPFDAELRKAYDGVIALDRHCHFMKPVSSVEFPEYYNVIAKPMHWLAIYAKIEQHEYLDSQAFVDDVNLVLDNAMQFNKESAGHHRAAVRIKNNARPILEQFQRTVRERTALWTKEEPDDDEEQTTQEPMGDRSQLDTSKPQDQQVDLVLVDHEQPANHEQTDIPNEQPDLVVPQTPNQLNGDITPNPEDEVVPATPTPEPIPGNEDIPNEDHDPPDAPPATDEPTPSQTGDLEPYIPLLHMLQDQTSASDDLPFILNADPLTSFLTYEKTIPKPPPPPPPPPPKRKHKKKQPTGDTAEPKASSRAPAPGTPRHHPPRVVLLVRDPAQAAEAGAPAEGSANATTTPAASSSKIGKRKRQDSESWGQVVTDVNAHTSFKLFESGWVLPPGSTRTRRPTFPPVPKTSGTGSRKQSKEPKRVRMSSSIAGDVQTPTIMSSRQSSQALPMELEVLGGAALEHPHRILTDDPASAASLTGSTSAQQPSASEFIEQIPTEAASVQPPGSNIQQKADSSSDLSELSDTEQRRLKPPASVPPVSATPASAPPVSAPPVSAPIAPATHAPRGIHQDEQGEPVHYEAGTLVWARQPGFPWYPAVVFEPPDEAIPPKIITVGHQIRSKMKVPEKLYLVQFYDRQRSWTWLPISRLAMLGEVPEIDQKYLHPTGKLSGNKKELQKAYDLALQEMETVEESQAATVSEPA